MASIQTVRNLLSDAKFELSGYDQNRIAEKTKQDSRFDYSAALASILECGAEREAIIEAINSTKMLYCGLCREGWIPVLDWRQWKEAGQPDLNQRKVFIPKMDSPCPKCQPNRHPSLSERLVKMTEAERGWTFCILYDFYVYSLENTDSMGDFDPHRLWGVFQQEPHRTGAMMDFMGWINHGLDERMEQAEEKARQVIHATATARAFG